MPNPKFPKEYMEGEVGFIKDPFRPEFRYDSRGRLVMPLPGYSKFMLSVEPGSKRIGQSTEDEAGNPNTEPGSIKTGYLHAQTSLRVGPEGGWIVQLAGGDSEYPISYFNETSKVINFYVDKAGNVYIKGKLIADADSEVDWSYIQNIAVENIHIAESLTVANTDADITANNPQLYNWISGSKPPIDADNTQDELDLGAAIDNAKADGVTFISGGYIATGIITATRINAGILTGRVVRTSSGTTRVEMNVVENALIVWENGNERVAIGAGVIAFLTPSGIGSGEIYGLGTNQLGFNVSGGGDYYMNASEFAPQSSGARNLGSSGSKFGSLYISGSVDTPQLSYVGGSTISITENFVPSITNSKGLGTSSLAWGSSYFGQTRARLLYPATSLTYDLGTSSIWWRDLFLKYLKFDSSGGKIYYVTTEILDFYSTKLMCKKPFGFQVRSGTPGAASAFQGHMYYDTAQDDLVFSNGTNWYKLTASQI